MQEFENDAARDEMVGNLVALSQSPVWQYMKSHLESLRKQAQDDLLSREIKSDKNMSPLEVTRREINYLDKLISMPEDLVKSLRPKKEMDDSEFDPKAESTSESQPSGEDP